MKANYQPWQIAFTNSQEMSDNEFLRHLLRFAVLAPSSHNSQPWEFEVNEQRIIITPDLNRTLKDSDPKNRELYISLGCAAETLFIAAAKYGKSFQIEIKESPEQIHLFLTNKHSSTYTKDQELADQIPQRSTNRSQYEMQPCPQNLLEELRTISNDFDLNLDRIDLNHPHRQRIINLVMDATSDAMASKSFREELSNYLKPNTTTSPIGMPCAGMYIPTPVSFIAPTIIKLFNIGKLTGKEERNLLEKHTPEFIILSHQEDTPKSWIQAGRALQRIWLTASVRGYALNPLAALVEIGAYFEELPELLGHHNRPLVFFRLGKPTKAAHKSPRLSYEQVLK